MGDPDRVSKFAELAFYFSIIILSFPSSAARKIILIHCNKVSVVFVMAAAAMKLNFASGLISVQLKETFVALDVVGI